MCSGVQTNGLDVSVHANLKTNANYLPAKDLCILICAFDSHASAKGVAEYLVTSQLEFEQRCLYHHDHGFPWGSLSVLYSTFVCSLCVISLLQFDCL